MAHTSKYYHVSSRTGTGKFSFRTSEEEKEEHRRFYAAQLQQHIAEMVKDGAFDVLFLDEAVYCVRNGQFEEAALLIF